MSLRREPNMVSSGGRIHSSSSDKARSSRVSSSKTHADSFEHKDRNMSATRELLKYSTEYVQNIERLVSSSRKELDELEKSATNKREEQSSLEDMEKQLVAKTKEIQNMKEEYQKEIYKIQQKNNDLERDNDRLKSGHNREENKTYANTKDFDDMKRRLERKENELRITKVELDDTKSRLSKLMGDKLTDNNPNIADLSDMNRPTKLAERYKQLYDNQWTDAFEVLEKRGGEEEQIISILLTFFTKTKEFCDQESKRQMEEIQKVITQSERVRKVGVPVTVVKYIKDCRKASATDSLKEIYQKYKTWLKGYPFSSSKYAPSIHDYTAECFEICWLMAIQDPPVMIASEPRQGETIKSEIYSTYTISGKIVDFLVWPALLLHAQGPVLTKGVVQPSKRPQSAPAVVRSSEGTNRYTTEHGAGHETFDANKREDVWSSRKSHEAWTDVNDDTDKYGHDNFNESRGDYTYGHLGAYKEKDLRHKKYPASHHSRGYDQTHMDTHLVTPTYHKNTYYHQYGTRRYDRTPYIPSEVNIARFFDWRQEYGATRARSMMGSEEYDRIDRYLKRA